MFSKHFMRCLIQHKSFQHDTFQQNLTETTFLNDEDGDFQIHSNEEQTNSHAIDQTFVTYSCMPGESSIKVTLDSYLFHPASTILDKT